MGRWHSLDPRTSSGWPSIRRAKATPSAAFLSPLMTYGSGILRSCPKKSTPFASMRHAPEVPKKLLKGKIALVAGATRGAGRGIAIALGAADVQSKSMSVEIGGCPNCRVSNVIVVTGNKARLQPIEEDSHAIFANALCGGGRLEQADEGRTGTRDGGL